MSKSQSEVPGDGNYLSEKPATSTALRSIRSELICLPPASSAASSSVGGPEDGAGAREEGEWTEGKLPANHAETQMTSQSREPLPLVSAQQEHAHWSQGGTLLTGSFPNASMMMGPLLCSIHDIEVSRV